MENVHIGPIKFFNDNEYLKKYGLNNTNLALSEKLKLTFTILNSNMSIYSIQAKLYGNQVLDFFSEKKEGKFQNQLTFDKFFICDFYFEKEQILEIILNKNNQKININVALGTILGSRQLTYIYKYDNNEAIMIKAEKFGNNNYSLKFKMQLRMNENNLEQSNFFNNKIYYTVTSGNTKLYKSEIIKNDGTFELVHIPICLLQPFYTVSFFIYNGNNQLLGSFNKSLQEIKQNNNKISNRPLIIPLNYNKNIYIFDYTEKCINYTFTDYINAGVQIALSIGIDFTGSNGHPLDRGTLHYLSRDKPNDYERAITSCGEIVGRYDYDQLFPVYGFGAIINSSPDKEASMCFNLNFNNNPDIKTMKNVIKTYHECIEQNKLTFSGPTCFAPLIREVISRINNKYEYHILMILTDGVIDDLQDTIDVLVNASLYPLSVIIVGIGDADFKKMDILDGDTDPLISTDRKVRLRDLVQFVPFSRFQNDEQKLAMEVLAEIPRQMIEYYQFMDITPENILKKKSQIGNIYQGFYDNVRPSQTNNFIKTSRNYYSNNKKNNMNENHVNYNNPKINSTFKIVFEQNNHINNINPNNHIYSPRNNNNKQNPNSHRNPNQYQNFNNNQINYPYNNNSIFNPLINNNNNNNYNNNNLNINNLRNNGINNNYNNELEAKKGKIDLNNLSIKETIFLNQNNSQNKK